ncbi:murein DD-endopeptidase MepM [Enterobacteriaceae bacterium LUAb1]
MQQLVRTVALTFGQLPRPHRVMLGALTIATLAVAIWRPYTYHASEEQAPAVSSAERHPLLLDASEPLDQAIPDDEIPQDEIDKDVPDETGTHEYIVSGGDTLSSILNQYGIEMSEITQLTASDADLRHMKIGQQLTWTLNDDGALQTVIWEINRRETRTYQRVANGFKMSSEIQKGEWLDNVIQGTVNGSFASSAQRAGLNRSEISAVIKAMQWQMDFRKLRKGDRFAVLLSQEMLDGKHEQSKLLGVRVHSGGKDYYAFRAADSKFYDRNAAGLARGFMRFPVVNQRRISSGFNPRRRNPVTGRIAPHKGVDFAMPLGTPVLAAGDGEVLIAKRSGAAGNYIAIRHGRQYTTRYMHLKKLLVTAGQKVKRGDRIALSGNTGRSTGPHLHYEIWINNQAVNPLTAKLPRSDGLTGSDRREYLSQVREMTSQLTFD